MDLAEYMKRAPESGVRNDARGETYLQVGLLGEIGEVAELLKKAARVGEDPDLDALRLELGDVAWYTAEIAKYSGIQLGGFDYNHVDKTPLEVWSELALSGPASFPDRTLSCVRAVGEYYGISLSEILEANVAKLEARRAGSAVKQGNPKDPVGVGKVPVSAVPLQTLVRAIEVDGVRLVPAKAVAELGLAMFEGARKYGRHNYRALGARASVYLDSVYRHLAAWYCGQAIDPESGIHHLSKAAAGLTILLDCHHNEVLVDDRPPRSKAPAIGIHAQQGFLGMFCQLAAWWDGSAGVDSLETLLLEILRRREEELPADRWVENMNEQAAALVLKHPDPAHTHTEVENA